MKHKILTLGVVAALAVMLASPAMAGEEAGPPEQTVAQQPVADVVAPDVPEVAPEVAPAAVEPEVVEPPAAEPEEPEAAPADQAPEVVAPEPAANDPPVQTLASPFTQPHAITAPAPETPVLPVQAQDVKEHTNSVRYWKGLYPNAECYKHKSDDLTEHGQITSGGTAVTLNAFQDSWPGDRWEVLIVKGGSVDLGAGPGNVVYELPTAGTAYLAPLNNGGQQAGVSHWIVCKGNAPTPPPPPVVEQCDAITGTTLATNLDHNGWTFGETRATGHNDFVDGGLHVWTESNASTDKAAGYHALNIPLADVGEPSITFGDFSGVRPGMQIGLDRDGNGTWDGFLVGEPWSYGEGQWWTSKAGFGVPSGGGYPSMGTLTEYLQANPDAQVLSVGYSLGSGVQGSAVITGLVFGCHSFVFDYESPIAQCPADLGTNHSTNLAPNGWTLVGDGEYVEDGFRLDVAGNWAESYLTRAYGGTIESIGTSLDFTADPTGFVGIHLVTADGTIVYEQEPTYGDNLWSTHDFGVGAGMGYASFGSLEDYANANPGLVVTEIRVLYTSPSASSTTITDATFGCVVYTFDFEVPPPPATPEPTATEWVDEAWECNDTQATQTRTVTTYAAPVWDGEQWVEDTVGTTVTETQVRDLDKTEQTVCPVVTPPVVTPPVVVPPVVTPPVTVATPPVVTGLASTGWAPWTLSLLALGLTAMGSLLIPSVRRVAFGR